MILRNDSYEILARDIIQNNRKIIIYGAGMIGKILVPYLLAKYALEAHVRCYVEQDQRKVGKKVKLYGGEAPIEPVSILQTVTENDIVLITNSNFYPVVKMLDEIHALDGVNAYLLAVMQIELAGKTGLHEIVKTQRAAMIPKKIHYCWFSGAEIPDNLKKCIESWKKFCPDYEIVRWDESNYDVNKNPYMRDAYAQKKWGFVPDIARLEILYEHGGIYLDTDVELVHSLDDFLYQPAFCGVEKWGNINTGGCSGAQRHNPVIKAMLDYRENIPFVYEDGSLNLETCGYYETMPLIQMGMEINNQVQVLGSQMTVYSSDFFHPFDYASGELSMTPNTVSIHHFNGGWLDAASQLQRAKTRQEYQNILHRMER